jgi:hypothetical protein
MMSLRPTWSEQPRRPQAHVFYAPLCRVDFHMT